MGKIDKKFIGAMLHGRQVRDWDENQHPRGKGGKFAKKGSGTGGSSGEGSEKAEKAVGREGNSAEKKKLSPFRKANPKEFRKTFHAAKAEVAKTHPEAAWRVDSTYSEDDYAGMDCHTTRGGSSVAIHNGDIVSVCHNPNDRETRGSDLLRYAVEHGGDRLDAFGGLYGFYIKNGFEPVSWCPFADKKGIRPDDWVRGRDRREPVIFFKYTGRPYEEIAKQFGERRSQFVRRVKRSNDYSAAQKARDDSISGG